MKNTTLMGQLEIDHDRGVIYFHLSSEADMDKLNMVTPLRIYSLPKPIRQFTGAGGDELDITIGVGVSWRGGIDE